jgi:hypothetical protein
VKSEKLVGIRRTLFFDTMLLAKELFFDKFRLAKIREREREKKKKKKKACQIWPKFGDFFR